MWIAKIYPKDTPVAYIGIGRRIVWKKEQALHFATEVEALAVAFEMAFSDESIAAEEVDDDQSAGHSTL